MKNLSSLVVPNAIDIIQYIQHSARSFQKLQFYCVCGWWINIIEWWETTNGKHTMLYQDRRYVIGYATLFFFFTSKRLGIWRRQFIKLFKCDHKNIETLQFNFSHVSISVFDEEIKRIKTGTHGFSSKSHVPATDLIVKD